MHYEPTPRWRFALVTVVCALLVILGGALGVWQLSRAHTKLALREGMERAMAQAPLDNHGLIAMPADRNVVDRRVRLRGHWLPEQVQYWDNFPMDGRAGLIVLMPLQLAQSDKAILVQRGWIARNFQDRSQLQPIDTPAGEQVVEGILAHWPSRRIALGGPETGRIRQNPDQAEWQAVWGSRLLQVTLRETGDSSQGLLRHWAPPDDKVATHYGYAFQWFCLSVLVAVYYIRFQIVNFKSKFGH